MRLRSEIRTRWRSWLGLALLIGLTGGAAVAAAAGARRTETAYPRFVQAQNGYDLVTGGFAGNIDPARVLAQMEAMPEVAQWPGSTWRHPRPFCRLAGWRRRRSLWPSPI